MKRMYKPVIILAASILMLSVTGCSISKPKAQEISAEEQLLDAVPEMDPSAYNRFTFRMDITAANMEGMGESFAMTGTMETRGDITHMYGLDIYSESSEHSNVSEAWTDLSTGEQYIDAGNGWRTGTLLNDGILDYLVDAISNRKTKMIMNDTDQLCTLAWTFPIDSTHLFGEMLGRYTGDMELDGYGRITAVFEPVTHKFQYFTIVASTSNKERASALLDAIFYWDIANSHEDALMIPEAVASAAYEAETGVVAGRGYDETVNPLAEEFISSYGGAAEVSHYEGGASMFWTAVVDNMSATVNYAKASDPTVLYEESCEFLTSFYGSPAEKADDETYFYGQNSGELVYITKGDNWYAEIIVTGEPGSTQGELRKPLITYKSKLGI